MAREEFYILLSLLIIFTSAKVAGELFLRLKQPVVIGELLVGALIGTSGLGLIHESVTTNAIAELGVIFLLFMIGLEIKVDDLVEVGRPAILVGVFGVLVPLAMGFFTFQVFGFDTIKSLFLGTALVSTSVGITARVLADMGLIKHRVSRIILGAAILDDVLGLLVLSVVAGLSHQGFNYVEFGILVAEATFFIFFLAVLGPRFAGRHVPTISRLRVEDASFAVSVILVLGLSVLAEYIGLAAIIGAFLAGIVLSETKESFDLEKKFAPLANFFIPFFFVVMGTRFDILELLKPANLLLLVVVMLVAALSKLIGAVPGTIRFGWKTAIQTGIGMTPRGEVGIVIGTLGLTMGIIDQNLYGIVLGMSILTTLMTPPLLKLAFKGEDTA